MIVGGEDISHGEAQRLITMVIKDARQFAGLFHQQNRSEKFRRNWPDEYAYADSEWRAFVDATLQCYAEKLGEPLEDQRLKRDLYLARLLWAMVERDAPERWGGLQLSPGSQAFEGDKADHRKIAEDYGTHANTIAELALPHRRFH